MVQFEPTPTNNNPTDSDLNIKLTLTVAAIDVQDNKERMTSEIFCKTPSYKRNWEPNGFRSSCKLCMRNHYSLQEHANIMQIQVHDEKDANCPDKIVGIDVITLCDIAASMSCTDYSFI